MSRWRFFVFFASDRGSGLAAQKRALLDRNISSRTVSRKAEQAINDDKEHKVRLRAAFFSRQLTGPRDRCIATGPTGY
jgi:hypothetical protein